MSETLPEPLLPAVHEICFTSEAGSATEPSPEHDNKSTASHSSSSSADDEVDKVDMDEFHCILPKSRDPVVHLRDHGEEDEGKSLCRRTTFV